MRYALPFNLHAPYNRIASFDNELHSTDTIAADDGQKAIGIHADRSDLFGDAPAQLFRIGKQVFKDGNNGLATTGVFTERQ